ncbi:zinc finger, CCHC-type containing protein [Tanacetum coccineum]
MTCNYSYFSKLNENITGRIKFEDGLCVRIKGKGYILFQGKNGEQKLLKDIYYILALRSNVISLGQATISCCDIRIRGDFLTMRNSCGNLLIKVPRSANRLYKDQLKVGKPYCLQANIDEESWLWHIRLGHVGFGAMNLMHKLAIGVPVIKHQDQVCESCMVGKQTKKSFSKKATYRASRILDMVHGDICGPITPSTQSGNSYILVLIGDCSRGGEFTSHEFNRFCDEEGIARMLTAPYAPQQNGIMEPRNRTLIEMTRCVIKARYVPNYFWGEAVRHAIYIINRTPIRALVGVTPCENFYEEKPNLEDLKVFGCVAYKRTVSKHLKKLDDRLKPLVYLGKEPSSGGFRLYNPHENKIIISAYVVFDEKKEVGQVWNNDATAHDASVHAKVDDATVHATVNTVHNLVTVHKTPFHVTSPEGDEDEYESDVTPILNNTWKLVSLPKDFDEVFGPVARLKTIRLLIALADGKGWKIHHLDVKMAFLHGELKEEVYVTQPKRFEKPGDEKKVYKLAKSLYGLRQALRAWNIKLDNTLKEMGTSLDCINELKRRMASQFEMSDLGELTYYLDESTQAILDVTVGGIFLYKTPNQAFQFLDDKVFFKLDWSTKSQNDHHQKFVSFTDGSDSNNDNSRFMEKLKAMDSQIISLNEELQDMCEKYNELRNENASKNYMNDDMPMCERHEANYIQSKGNKDRNSHDSFSHQSLHDPNDSEKSLTELNNNVRNDLEDFKRCIREALRKCSYGQHFYDCDDLIQTQLLDWCFLPTKKV